MTKSFHSPLVLTLPILLILSLNSCSKSDVPQGGSQASKEKTESRVESNMTTSTEYLQYPFTTITGDTTSLASFAGKVVMIVNTASECGYTKQYAGLQALYDQYKDSGLVIVGFPANNYGGQEPGSDAEIATFCSKNYGVTFPMMAKISVDGDDKHPLFTYLTEQSSIPGKIKWNFGKFLLDKEGKLIARFDSGTEPQEPEVVSAIVKLL